MVLVTEIKKNLYKDSIQLMRISQSIKSLGGVVEAAVIMATETNISYLLDLGLYDENKIQADNNDIIIAVKAENRDIAEEALRHAEDELLGRVKAFDSGKKLTGGYPEVNTFQEALRIAPEADLVFISVPGKHAALVTKRALEAGRNVMLFSDNVPLEDEVELKREAQKRGLLVMGPDCGTAIIDGKGYGFANKVRKGTIGIAGASGTGIQELSVLIDRFGGGISHALGTGSRDLRREVGGISMLRCVDLLEKDDSTEVIIVISKPPDPIVEDLIIQRINRCQKPVVINILGGDILKLQKNCRNTAATLEEAAYLAIKLSGIKTAGEEEGKNEKIKNLLADLKLQLSLLGPEQKYLRGLFTGGTLAYEAQLILKNGTEDSLFSNIPLPGIKPVKDLRRSEGHTILDLGDDLLTQGRPHPIIDPEIRHRFIRKESGDPSVAVIMLDLILGYGSNKTAVDDLSRLIKSLKGEKRKSPVFLVHVCGTERDAQNLSASEKLLVDAGAVVCESNALMAMLALKIINWIG